MPIAKNRRAEAEARGLLKRAEKMVGRACQHLFNGDPLVAMRLLRAAEHLNQLDSRLRIKRDAERILDRLARRLETRATAVGDREKARVPVARRQPPSRCLAPTIEGRVRQARLRCHRILPAGSGPAASRPQRGTALLEGFGPGGLVEDLKVGLGFVMRNHSAFKRFAFVTDKEWAIHAMHLFGWMVPGEFRLFRLDELEQAKEWAAG